ncbi:MAG: peptidoglycan-binding protein [bacterium]|nr:MAG: peptidoglycan-binding protein [bacterium]
MNILRRGSRGRLVRFLQIALNTHLNPQPRIKVDGLFGPKTEKAVLDFQVFAGLDTDGIVGPKTWNALLEPAKVPVANLKKFKSQLGTVADFANHLQKLELTFRDPKSLLKAVSNFTMTANGARYLLIGQDPRVIDFRHFFAAASEAYGGSLSRKSKIPIGGSRGEALLLGVANEIGQCVDEGLKLKLNSCFSREDLGSNRLGAEFGRTLLIARSEANQMRVHQQLRVFLAKLAPKPPKAIGNTELPGPFSIVSESVTALVIGIIDVLIPDAY